MALLTRFGMHGLLRKIMETGGLTEDMESLVTKLKDDFDEREGILKKYGEVYDGEDKEEYDYAEKAPDEDKENWKGKYEDMRSKYLDRFFGGEKEEVNETLEETKEDVKRDGEPQTFDELLEKREGGED